MTFDELKEKAHALPLKPGVYIMQDAKNEVIYVGKAKALKNRVSQYFANLASHTEKTRAMVSQIDHFDVIVADSEFEALILENSLIKRHQPHYNILLKDDKGYPYIRLTVKEPYPRFSLANRAAEDGARYFGPYGSRGSTQNIIDALRVALKLPSCSRKFPRDIGKERPCLNYHMGQCDGYCRKEMDQTRYREAIDQAVRLLEGQFKEVGEELLAEMEQAAEELRFEKAAELRDRFKAIELLGCYEPSFRYFAGWWQQLFGESEGKDGKGLFPATVEFTADLHSLGQMIQQGQRNLFETIVRFAPPRKRTTIEVDWKNLDGLNYLEGKTLDFVEEQAFQGTLSAHVDGGVPNIVLQTDEVDADTLGELFYFFELSCGISAYMLGVNPFNQPGVEFYKKNMFHLLGKPGY